MRYGETGYNLEIDLSTGNIERVETDPKWTELFLGGQGTNAKLIWDRVTPETKPFDAENPLIFGSGLLGGTHAVGANRTMVSAISPTHNFFAYSMMGGFFASEMKYAGYDKIIFSGKSDKLVYAWIKDGKVELRDASHLAGKGAVETQQLIKDELGEPRAHVAAIGLAGENKVLFASIEQGRSSASRLGMGAVMGDKKLKAVAVRGTQDIIVADPAAMMDLTNDVMEYIQFRQANPIIGYTGAMTIMGILGTPQEMLVADEKWHTENFMWGNSRDRRKNFWTQEVEEEWHAVQSNVRTRLISCYNCPLKCGATITIPGESVYMMKCFTKLTYTMAAYSDLDFGFRIARRATEYGIDGYSAPQVMAFAVECLNAGIIPASEFAGCPEDVNGRFYWLLDRIANREGIGDMLADGTYYAAEKLGAEAQALAHNNIRKHEQLPLKLGAVNPIYYLMYCTNEKSTITQIEGQFPQAPFPTQEMRDEYCSDWFQVPNEKMKEYVRKWEFKGEFAMPYYPDKHACCEIVDWMERMHYVDDACGVCSGISSFHLKPPYHLHNYPKIISAATGMDLDTDGLVEITKRNRNLVRAINCSRGLRREDDIPPEDHWKKRLPEYEKELLDTYFEYKGWDMDGVPTKETFVSLGLDYVAEEFEKRGIYDNGKS
ncbi:MAG: aldehyde dehydrogenase [Peptococcaceae bacterium]|nr:aldehyde dehydrogenase [Peptococcaceae bacterium]